MLGVGREMCTAVLITPGVTYAYARRDSDDFLAPTENTRGLCDMADSITVIGMRAAKQKRRGKKGKKGKGIKKLTPEEMKFKLKENDKSIRGMQKQLFEIEVQAHTNRKEVDGVRASVKRILKAHDLAMNTQGENVNVRIVAARVQDQVTAVSNVLRSHETVLSQVYSTL